MSGSVTATGYALGHRPYIASGDVQLVSGEVDGAYVSGIAYWHPEALLWRVVLTTEAGMWADEREVSTMVDACHAVRDMARERAGYVAPVRYPFEVVQ